GLEGGAFLADFLEPGGDHDEPSHAAPARFVDDADYLLLRHDDDGEVDVVVDRRDRRVALHRVDDGGVRVHGEDLPGELQLEQIPDDLTADRRRLARGADHGDRPRAEERVETFGAGGAAA